MAKIDILQEPPSKHDIKEMRRNLSYDRQKGSAPDPTAPNPMLYPAASIFYVFIIIAAHLIVNWPAYRRLKDVPGAVDRDWSNGEAVRSYVEKVRAQGRDLIRIEVRALKSFGVV